MALLIISLILLSYFTFADSRCFGKDGLGCCSGTVWDKVKQECIECSPGYFGLNCTKKCPFPRYGKTYQFRCSCLEVFCDVATGCQIDEESETDRQTSKFERSSLLSEESENITINPVREASAIGGGKTSYQLSIEDIKQILKENETHTWELGLIIVSSLSTCIILTLIFTVIFFVHKSCKKQTRPKHPTSSVGLEEYTDFDMIELNVKTDKIIFEGLANAKKRIQHSSECICSTTARNLSKF